METASPALQNGLMTPESPCIPVPSNIVNLPSGLHLRPDQTALLDDIRSGRRDLQQTLVDLSLYWKVRVWFTRPVTIRVSSRREKQVDECVIPRFFIGQQSQWLCYTVSRRHVRGYQFPAIEKIVKYEPVFDEVSDDAFKSYEEFREKFDLYFITEAQIQSLWNEKSAQHGGQYRKSDFHRIGSKGLRCLERFLGFYRGISNGNGAGRPGYLEKKPDPPYQGYHILSMHAESHHHLGRHITISHQTNIDHVYYASEYDGCANGRYGLLANRREFLWLEDD
jgi:hypothetical protein